MRLALNGESGLCPAGHAATVTDARTALPNVRARGQRAAAPRFESLSERSDDDQGLDRALAVTDH